MFNSRADKHEFTDEWGIHYVRRIWHLEYRDVYQLHWMACPSDITDPEAWAYIPVCYCTQFSAQIGTQWRPEVIELILRHIESSFRWFIHMMTVEKKFICYNKPFKDVAFDEFRFQYITNNFSELSSPEDDRITFDTMTFVREGDPAYVIQENPYAMLSIPQQFM